MGGQGPEHQAGSKLEAFRDKMLGGLLSRCSLAIDG